MLKYTNFSDMTSYPRPTFAVVGPASQDQKKSSPFLLGKTSGLDEPLLLLNKPLPPGSQGYRLAGECKKQQQPYPLL